MASILQRRVSGEGTMTLCASLCFAALVAGPGTAEERAPTVVADPVAAWQEGLNGDCQRGWKDDVETPGAPRIPRGDAILGPTFVRWIDLDGDGLADLILNPNDHECEGGRFSYSMYCGSAGCLTEFWFALPDGGYQLALSQNVREFEVVEYEGRPGIEFRLHGVFCDRTGSVGCVEIRQWDGTELRTVWKDY